MPTETAYSRYCREACEWCAKGFTPEYHSFGDGPLHWSGLRWVSCTALSESRWAEQLATKCAALEGVLTEVAKEADSYGCNHEDEQDEDTRLCSGDDCKRCFLLKTLSAIPKVAERGRELLAAEQQRDEAIRNGHTTSIRLMGRVEKLEASEQRLREASHAVWKFAEDYGLLPNERGASQDRLDQLIAALNPAPKTEGGTNER